MKIHIKYWLIFILFLGIFQSCENTNTPIIEEKSFLIEIPEIVISMNGVSSTHTVIINKKKYNTVLLGAKFISDNKSLIDSSNIIYTIKNDSININIEPKIGKYGNAQVSLIVNDSVNIDTTNILVKVTFDERNNQYPTKLYPLSSTELAELRNQCVFEIDKYGLICYTGTLSRGQSNILIADSAVALTKRTIIQYSKFTNVFSESSLSLKEVSNYNPMPIPRTDWTVIFKNQIYDGLEVLNTEIIAIVQNKVASLKGHHHKNIFIPKENIIPIERIKKILVGQVFKYECWGSQEFVILENLISNEIVQKIYWEEIENQIEYRVVWSVPILSSYGGNVMFYLYVDVLSGEIISINYRFIC